jgi:flagella basal body P-ring formation protein FlgA
MRCSRRSTTWFARTGVLLACALQAAAAAGGDQRTGGCGTTDAAVRRAIVEAVKGRMGPDTELRIEGLHVGGRAAAAGTGSMLVASPEPGARLGRPVRFSLACGVPAASRPQPAGYAVAAVFVTADHARTARTIARGETLAAEDLVESRSEVGAVLLQRLPRVSEVAGARALRDVLADEVVTRSIAAVRPLVQSGDAVDIRAHADGVVVQAQGVAGQSGEVGDTILVVNRESRRRVRARVVAPGTVEVIQ